MTGGFMFPYFEEQKQKIFSFLSRQLEKENGLHKNINPFSLDVRKRLFQYAGRGKMIRGGLVVLGYELFAATGHPAVIACAAAAELFQSALLVHDDIMDHDTLRRGEKTLHREYTEMAEKDRLKAPVPVGESLGICLGDIAFFLAFQMIAEAGGEAAALIKLIGLFSREMAHVGAAQMLDVYSGAQNARDFRLSEEEIINLYRYKTGRYTFSLPLAAGALLAGQSDSICEALEELGEKLGIIFQIKDDELDLFGDESVVGKPIGSDIREGKKTILFTRLLQKTNENEKKQLLSLWGNPNLSKKDVELVRSLVVSHKIPEDIEEMMAGMAEQCRREIELLPATQPEKKEILTNLLDYNLSRRI
jgi:geranylgeranyl diphosphate synthase type I